MSDHSRGVCLASWNFVWQCMKNGRTQPLQLFLFVKIQKWSRYPWGVSCFPCSSATWQGLDLLLPILSPPPPPSKHLSLPPCHSLLLAGKSEQAAVETDWLRRRPGRCTEDKFVFVSRAATLGGRTLSRSCQILPPLKNTPHAPTKKKPSPPTLSCISMHVLQTL